MYDLITNVHRKEGNSIEFCMESLQYYIKTDSKIKLGHSLKGYVLRYGVELGNYLYNFKNITNKKDLSSLITRYGEVEGRKRYEKHISIDNSGLVIDNYEKKHNLKFDEPEICFLQKHLRIDVQSEYYYKLFLFDLITNAYRLSGESFEFLENSVAWWLTNQKDRSVLTLENVIKRYGRLIGTEKYNEGIAYKSEKGLLVNTYQHFVDTYGDAAEIEWGKFKESITNTQEAYIKRHGEIDGVIKWNQYTENLKNSNTLCTEHYINKGYSEKESISLAKKANQDRNYNHVHGKASKESLNVFNTVIEYITSLGVMKDDIFIGIEGSREYRIKTKHHLFLYDFTIMSLKLIIEFHGVKYHVREVDGELEYNNTLWVKDKEKAIEKYNRDVSKIKHATDKGFKVLVIWSDTPVKDNIELCKNFINENMLGCHYENLLEQESLDIDET